eukprot:49867-Chlamydomonas_euryale.AAC.1
MCLGLAQLMPGCIRTPIPPSNTPLPTLRAGLHLGCRHGRHLSDLPTPLSNHPHPTLCAGVQRGDRLGRGLGGLLPPLPSSCVSDGLSRLCQGARSSASRAACVCIGKAASQ